MIHDDLFQFSIENALEIIIIFNADGTIVYANRMAKQQLEYGEALYECLITDIFPGEFQGEDGVLKLNGKRDDDICNMMAYRKNRTCFPAKVRILDYKNKLPIHVETDTSDKQAYICMAYNASNESFLERRVSQAGIEAEEALKVKSEFVANVTHELRTPVNGILGNTQELINRETQKDKLELLRLVERGCRDMNSIINNILDFSKLEAGKFILEPRRFNFREMINYVRANHGNRIAEKGLDFTIMVSPEIPEYIIGDELRIVQVLNNLISNAYKFTSVGEIHVEVVKTAQTGNRAELFFMVIDTGIGIAKTNQDKLFRSFSQVDASISRKYGGTGLGLNICKQLVELMGGSIHVESDVGKGTMFSFDIWVEMSKEDLTDNKAEFQGGYLGTAPGQTLASRFLNVSENGIGEDIWKFGEKANKEEIEKKMSKLILCFEMENWEKAETFAETIKQLVEDAPKEIKSAALRLKMAVQKADYEKSTAAFEKLQQML